MERGKRKLDEGPALLRVVPSRREVPPLTDGEILALRRMLVNAEAVAEGCPVARRILSER